MIRIMFVCHGNICRSTMAEFVMKDMIKKEGISDKVYVASAATSREEIGNPVHYGTRNKLRELGISTEGKYAVQLTKADYKEYDYIFGMDRFNINNILRITDGDPEGKVSKLLDLTNGRDIADPWYTGNFDETYDDVLEGCTALLKKIRELLKKPNKKLTNSGK